MQTLYIHSGVSWCSSLQVAESSWLQTRAKNLPLLRASFKASRAQLAILEPPTPVLDAAANLADVDPTDATDSGVLGTALAALKLLTLALP